MDNGSQDNPSRTADAGWIARLRQRGVLRVAFSYAVIAWLLLQIGDVVIEPLGAPAWAMRALIVLVVTGFPLALLLTWFFELTPSGIELDSLPAGAARPKALGIRRYADVLIIGILLIAVVWLLMRQEGWVEPDHGLPVIAVLPFTELGAAQDSYFGAGLSDTLIHKLGQLSQLVVLASSSTFEFREQGLDLRTVGAKLSASSILEGTVQRAGNQLRINARLVEVESGQQLWSGSFERQSSDLFAVQDEIAAAVSEALAVVLSPDDESRLAKPSTLSLSAYDAYLIGKSKLADRNRETIGEAIPYFHQAIELDSSYALAYTGLAEALYLTSVWRPWDVDWEIRGPEIQRAAATAQSLDPELGEAYLSQAFAAMGDNEFRASDTWPDAHIAALLKRAVQLSPNNANALKFYSNFVESTAEALHLLQQAAQLDPSSSIIRYNIGEKYLQSGETDLALEWMLKAANTGDRIFLESYKGISEIYLYDTMELDEAARWGRAFWNAYPEEWSANASYLRPLLELGAWEDVKAVLLSMPAEAEPPPLPGLSYVGLSVGATLAAAEGDMDRAEELANSFSRYFYETWPAWPDLSKVPFHRVLDIMALADIGQGKPQEALARYRTALPDPAFWSYINRGAPPLPTPALFAVLHRLTGDEETCDRLLRESLVHIADEPIIGDLGVGFLRFTLNAFLGETDAAIEALEEAINAGWLPGWWALKLGDFDPRYAVVTADPRFIRLHAGLEERVKRMREDFLRNPGLPENVEVK